jgi:hypothetical protein
MVALAGLSGHIARSWLPRRTSVRTSDVAERVNDQQRAYMNVEQVSRFAVRRSRVPATHIAACNAHARTVAMCSDTTPMAAAVDTQAR